MKEEILKAFENLLIDSGGWKPDSNNLSFERIDQEEARELEKPFTEKEIFKALFDFKGDKVLGPDGFPMGFWHFSWDFVKEDVLRLFNEFHNKGCFVKSMNATFLVLVPKKGGVEDLKDYRPISLVGGLYKWLAKVLANRLKGCVSKVISKAQNAFVEDR